MALPQDQHCDLHVKLVPFTKELSTQLAQESEKLKPDGSSKTHRNLELCRKRNSENQEFQHGWADTMWITLHILKMNKRKKNPNIPTFPLDQTWIPFGPCYVFIRILLITDSVPASDNILGSLIQVTFPPDTLDMILITKDIKRR